MKYRHILLADDDPEDREMIADAFSEIGSSDTIDFVENGEEALRRLDGLADAELPRLVILDLNMPILNGTQTLLKIRDNPRYKSLQVVIFSTSVNPHEKEACLVAGAHSYVTKPMLYRDALDTARRFLDLAK